MNQDEKTVLEYLTNQCRGEANASPRNSICRMIDSMHKLHLSPREFRDITGNLIDQGHPVVWNDEGIFLAETPDEIDRAALKLISMGQRDLDRGHALQSIAKKKRDINHYTGVGVIA